MKYVIINILLLASIARADFQDRIKTLRNCETPIVSKDGDWRETLINWAYQIIDHWNFNRANVSYGVEIFEHFIAKWKIPRKDYPLYFSTSLMIAIKLNEYDLRLASMVKYSNGLYGKDELRLAEKTVLEVLRWKTYYPIPAQYISTVFEYIREKRFHLFTDHMRRLANFVEDMAMHECEVSLYKPKSISSYGRAKNCMIDAINKTRMSDGERDYFFNVLAKMMRD